MARLLCTTAFAIVLDWLGWKYHLEYRSINSWSIIWTCLIYRHGRPFSLHHYDKNWFQLHRYYPSSCDILDQSCSKSDSSSIADHTRLKDIRAHSLEQDRCQDGWPRAVEAKLRKLGIKIEHKVCNFAAVHVSATTRSSTALLLELILFEARRLKVGAKNSKQAQGYAEEGKHADMKNCSMVLRQGNLRQREFLIGS